MGIVTRLLPHEADDPRSYPLHDKDVAPFCFR